MITRGLVRGLTTLIVPAVLLAVWWTMSANSTSYIFPPLGEIADGFVDTWSRDRLVADLLPSLFTLGAGFAAAIFVGIGVGTLLGVSPRLYRDLRPVLEFLRAMPVVALVPIALIVIGPGTTMESGLVAFAATWPILISTTDAVRGADTVMLETMRAFGLSRRQTILRGVVPGALPQVFAGVRIGAAAAVATMVIANMLGSSSGLGYLVISAQQSFDINETWAGLLMIGIVGCSLTSLLVLAERCLLGWHRQWRALDRDRAA